MRADATVQSSLPFWRSFEFLREFLRGPSTTEMKAMTTIRDFCVQYCTQRGMFDSQAEAVVEQMMADPALESMAGRWDDRVSDYPQPMLAVLVMSLRSNAVSWIEENLPKAWYKPMFDGTAEQMA